MPRGFSREGKPMTAVAGILGSRIRTPDLTGRTFWDWTVLDEAPRLKSGCRVWRCQCKCGTVSLVQHSQLTVGRSRRCRKHGRSRHGHSSYGIKTAEYVSWISMRSRVKLATKSHKHRHWIGVKIDPRWDVFENFLADMGWRPPGTSLDRYDPKTGKAGDYGPGLCRWATASEQMRNRDPFLMKCPDGEIRLIDPRGSETP